MTSVCILGAKGFVGSHLAKRFDTAVVLGRGDLDLLDKSSVNEYFTKNTFNLIIHCAAIGGSRLKMETEDIYDQNVSMFTNVYETRGYKHMIWFSSGAADGNTPYGRAKKHVEDLVHTDPRVHVIKIWGCFGPNEPSQRLLASGIREGRVVISKDRFFDFVHVHDVVDTVTAIIQSSYTLEPRRIHMVYPGSHVLLSDVLKIANIPFVIENPDLAAPYTGESNFHMLRPILEDRVRQYVCHGL